MIETKTVPTERPYSASFVTAAIIILMTAYGATYATTDEISTTEHLNLTSQPVY